MSDNQQIGAYGEKLACDYLKRHGYKILRTNYKASHQELDIIAEQGDFVVFVEVKTRTSFVYGDGTEAVEWKKQASLRKAITQYLIKEQPPCSDVRADLITVFIDKINKTARIKHYEDIL